MLLTLDDVAGENNKNILPNLDKRRLATEKR